MRRRDLWSLREDVHVEVGDDGEVTLRSRWGDLTLPPPGRVGLEALRRMSFGPVSLEHICYGEGDRARLEDLLDRLQPLVIRSVAVDSEQPLMSVVPISPHALFRPSALDSEVPVRLSRFAVMRTDGAGYVLESPLSLHRVELHRPEAVRLVEPLGRPITPRAAAEVLGRPEALVVELLSLLAGTGIVATAEDTGDPRVAAFAEDTAPALATWAPFALMFLARSTVGRHDYDFGAVYPMGRRWEVEPVVKRSPDVPGVALPRPRWDDLLAADPPLVTAIEEAGQAASFGKTTVTAAELGKLLYRSARVRALVPPPSDDSAGTGTSDRPYLNIGGCYEFELYLTLNHCPGIERGVYHYDPLAHRLEAVSLNPADVDELLEGGRLAAGLADAPPVLISVTARFRRLSRRYNGLSYALALKNVGALLQTLHLVAAAMGLTTRVAEIVDIDVSARVLGLDWRAEAGVADLAIGHPPESAGYALESGEREGEGGRGTHAGRTGRSRNFPSAGSGAYSEASLFT